MEVSQNVLESIVSKLDTVLQDNVQLKANSERQELAMAQVLEDNTVIKSELQYIKNKVDKIEQHCLIIRGVPIPVENAKEITPELRQEITQEAEFVQDYFVEDEQLAAVNFDSPRARDERQYNILRMRELLQEMELEVSWSELCRLGDEVGTFFRKLLGISLFGSYPDVSHKLVKMLVPHFLNNPQLRAPAK